MLDENIRICGQSENNWTSGGLVMMLNRRMLRLVDRNAQQNPVKKQTFRCRAWCKDDDPALRVLMRAQMCVDPGWPPDYAKSGDLAGWLQRPATLGQWVALGDTDTDDMSAP